MPLPTIRTPAAQQLGFHFKFSKLHSKHICIFLYINAGSNSSRHFEWVLAVTSSTAPQKWQRSRAPGQEHRKPPASGTGVLSPADTQLLHKPQGLLIPISKAISALCPCAGWLCCRQQAANATECDSQGESPVQPGNTPQPGLGQQPKSQLKPRVTLPLL